jgi:hypothetical protein
MKSRRDGKASLRAMADGATGVLDGVWFLEIRSAAGSFEELTRLTGSFLVLWEFLSPFSVEENREPRAC